MSGRIEDLTGVSITSESGKKYVLKKVIGSGSQGVVYEDDSEKYVVKFYYLAEREMLDI